MIKDKLIPKIRFKDFENDGAWEQRELRYVLVSQLKGKAKAEMSGTESVYLDTAYLNGGEASYVDSPKNVEKDDVLILWDGSQAGTVYHGFEGALGSTLKAYKPKESGSFLYQYLKRQQQVIYESYRTPNIPHVVKSFTTEFKISVPDVEEQEKIGEFFASIDNLITLHQRKLKKIKDIKSAYLSEMFPKEGEKYPKRRFAGFTDPWEQRKLGELGSVAMNRRIFKEETSDDGEVPFYKIGTFGGEPDAFISRELFEEYKTKYSYPKKGDILISASGSIGRTVEYTGKDEYFQDSNIVWLEHDERIENSFLKQFYSVVKWSGLEGSTIKRLYNKNILDTPISLPKVEEQKKLGLFFNEIDNLITLHQCKLEKLENIKKAYLNEMFV